MKRWIVKSRGLALNRILALAFCVAALALAFPPKALAGSAQAVSRAYPWSSDRLRLEIPAEVHFHPGPRWHLTIRAPERTLERLVVGNGVIKARSTGCFSLVPFCIGFGTLIDHAVDVELTGPALRSIHVVGSGTIDLEGVHQDRLRLKITGSATVRGSGTVHSATVQILGAGKIDLAQLTEARAKVLIRGSGTVDIAPTDSVSVRIEGAGMVRLHSNPRQVVSHIFGAGQVIKVPAGKGGAAHASG